MTSRFARVSLVLFAGFVGFAASAAAADLDGDGVPDDTDNCVAVSNPSQTDTDGDGFGNRCDGDFNNDGVVNFVDLARMKQSFFKQDALTDMNGDGVVNFGDLALLKAAFFKAPGPKCPTCPVDPCARGHALLCPGLDVVGADAELEKCLAATDPATKPQQFQSATFFRAITRVARPAFEQKPGVDPARIDSFSEALDALGVGAANRNPLDFTASLPLLPDRTCTVPPGVHEDDLERALITELMPRLDAAIASLPAVQAGWVDHCDVSRFGRTGAVEIDGSDALLLRAQLHALRGSLHLLAADDLDFDIGTLCTDFREGPLPTIESFLAHHPAFATRVSSQEAQAARLDFMESLDLFSDALDAIHAEVDPQSDDFVFIDANDPNGLTPDREAALRARIDYARVSLVSAILVPPGVLLPREIAQRICGDASFFLGALFNGPGLRSALPPFVGNAPDVDHVSDPSFGGLFPEQAVDGLRCALDEDGPLADFTPAATQDYETPSFDSGPVPIQFRILDARVGAGAGSPIDPTSVLVMMSIYGDPFHGGGGPGCSSTLNGVAAARDDSSGSVDVTSLFHVTSAADGSLVLDADFGVATAATTQSCDGTFYLMASDVYGNIGYGYGAVRIYSRGPVVKLSPPYYYGGSPAPFSVSVSVPFGDVNLANVRIRAETNSFSPCTDLRVNGLLVAPVAQAALPFATADITPLLSVTNGPGAATRTWSGSITANAPSGQCTINLAPGEVVPSSFTYPSSFFTITP